nr:hypothetical protein [Colwellia sp. PAMC 20917]
MIRIAGFSLRYYRVWLFALGHGQPILHSSHLGLDAALEYVDWLGAA